MHMYMYGYMYMHMYIFIAFENMFEPIPAPSLLRFPLGHSFKTPKERSIQPQSRGHCQKMASTGRYAAGAESGLRPSRRVTIAVRRCAKHCGVCIYPKHTRLAPPIHYIPGYLPAVFSMPIQSIYNVLLPIKYLYTLY